MELWSNYYYFLQELTIQSNVVTRGNGFTLTDPVRIYKFLKHILYIVITI